MDEAQAGVVAAPPPPPSEVKIRTMRSDLASMASSGGGSPQFENVKFSGPSAAQAPSGGQASGIKFRNKNDIALLVALVVVLIALSIVGWFLYQKFSAIAPPAQPAPDQTQTNQSSSASQAQSGLVPVPSSTPSVGQ
jgi:hypothetical protein